MLQIKVRLILPVLVLFSISFSTFAQYIYRKGIVEYKNGQTKDGWIGSPNWNKLPACIHFRKTAHGSEILTLCAKDIKGFFIIDGERYIATSTGNDVKFLISLVEGHKANLATAPTKTESGIWWTYFISGSDKPDSFYILHPEKEDGGWYRIVPTGYVFQRELLKFIDLVNFPRDSAYRVLIKSKYERQDLVRVTDLINKRQSGYKLNPEVVFPIVDCYRLELFGGMRTIHQEYHKIGNASWLSGLKRGATLFPDVFAGAEFFNRTHHRALRLRAELGFSGYKVDGIPGPGWQNYFSMSVYDVSLNGGAAYDMIHTRDGSRLFIGLFPGLHVKWSFNNNLILNQATTYQSEKRDYLDIDPAWIELRIKVGIVLKRRLEFSVFKAFQDVWASDENGIYNPTAYGISLAFHFPDLVIKY